MFVCPPSRQALNEAKKQNHSILERLQAMQADTGDTEVRCAELEGQVRQANTVRDTWNLGAHFRCGHGGEYLIFGRTFY